MKKQLKEWSILIGIMSILYLTGLHTEVAGFLQRIILSTGIMQAEFIDEGRQLNASYNFKLTDTEGRMVDFDQFKGQTVFLNFWATWCPPCVAEMPDIHDLYLKMETENIAFVLISQDNDFNKARNYLEKNGFTFPIYQLMTALPEVYASRSIPTTFVISPQGKIIAKRVGMAKYDTDEFRNLLLTASVERK